MMEDDLSQAYAQLNVHNHILRAILARILAGLPEDDARALLEDIVAEAHTLRAPPDRAVDDETAARIIDDSHVLIERFADRVWRQAQKLRTA